MRETEDFSKNTPFSCPRCETPFKTKDVSIAQNSALGLDMDFHCGECEEVTQFARVVEKDLMNSF